MPYFLRSLARASRVRSPSFFNRFRSSMLYSTSARAMPSRTAPACPDTPPPATVARMSNLSAAFGGVSVGRVLVRRGWGGKEGSQLAGGGAGGGRPAPGKSAGRGGLLG